VNLNIDFFKAILSATLWSSVFLAYVLYRKREAPGAIYLFLLMILSVNWTGAILLQLVADSGMKRAIGLAISDVCVTVSPSIFLAFVFDFLGNKKRLKWQFFLKLNILPVLALLVSFIPSAREAWWGGYVATPSGGVSFSSYLLLYWLWTFYLYAIFLASFILLIKGLTAFATYFKKQISIFIVASVFPLFFNLPYSFHLNGFPPIDLTPVGFLITVCILIFGIYSFHVFDIIPVAKEKVLETINDAVIVIDKYSRVVMYNKAFRNYFNLGESKLIGRYLDHISSSLGSEIASLDQSKSDQCREFVFQDKTFELCIKPLYRDRLTSKGKMIVLHDITPRKKMEEQLHLSNLHLQEQLLINERMIDDLKAFSYTVAHNLKTPVNNIVGFSELMVSKVNEGKFDPQWANLILNSGLKVSQIIDGLLLFSSISVKEVLSEPVDMGQVVEEALKRNEREIAEKKVSVRKPEKWPVAMGYAPWIEEVWANLISNAIKYGGEPPVLSFGFERNDTGSMVFYLQDNGDGISKDQIDQLFIPFNSLNTNKDIDSHGLGLSIVKRIISKQKGRVWAVSENIPGKGSRFCFTLSEKN